MKLGNVKRCADMDCGHSLGAHQGLPVDRMQGNKPIPKMSGKHIVSLDDEENSSVQIQN